MTWGGLSGLTADAPAGDGGLQIPRGRMTGRKIKGSKRYAISHAQRKIHNHPLPTPPARHSALPHGSCLRVSQISDGASSALLAAASMSVCVVSTNLQAGPICSARSSEDTDAPAGEASSLGASAAGQRRLQALQPHMQTLEQRAAPVDAPDQAWQLRCQARGL